MSTIRKRDILAIVVIAAMLIAMVPTMVALFPAMVSANDNGTVSGNFTTGNVNPTITSVSITTIGDGTVTTGMSMTPYTSYKAKIVAGDANEINDIDRVEVVIYFDQTDGDSDSDPGDVGYTQTIACLTWVKGPGWSILPNSGNTTWALNSGDCSVPTNLTAPSGIWVCGFRVGKVAKEAAGGIGKDGWDLFGHVADENASNFVTYWNHADLGMNWYGEINITDTEVSFGTALPGCTNRSATDNISVTYIANSDYDEQIMASTPWSGSGTDLTLNNSGTPGSSGEFALNADDDGALTADTIVRSDQYTNLDNTGTITDDLGDTVATNGLWLSLSSSGIPNATYSGSIYYKINTH